MYTRILSIVLVMAVNGAIVAGSAHAKEIYLSIGGSVGSFRTDLRIFNPSFSKSIVVDAYLLAVGGVDNSAVQPKAITIGTRQMAVYDDVVTSLFGASGLGGVRLSSKDDFIANQRIFAVVPAGTLGQFVPGLDVTAALKDGILIALRSSGSPGVQGTFRTNLGAVNPNDTIANVKWRIYDRNNLPVGLPKVQELPAFAVVAPTALTAFGSGIPPNTDLSDCWVSFESDQAIFVYASVVDNGTSDPTFIPASEDTGNAIPGLNR